MDKKELKEKIKRVIGAKKRKHTAGKVNIENVSTPRKNKPKKHKEAKEKKHSPGQVSVGAHGGRYVIEPSGHKRYVKEGNLAGTKRYKKSVKDVVKDVLVKASATDFVQKYKQRSNK